MSEIPALYGQYDDEGGPLWLDGAVGKLFVLRAENARLREALKPLSRIDCLIDEADPGRGYAFDRWQDNQVVFGIGGDRVISAGDLRRARAALSGEIREEPQK